MVEQLEAGEVALADAVTELESVEVPEEAQAGHPELVAGIDDLRALFEKTAKPRSEADSGGRGVHAHVSALGLGGRRDRHPDRRGDPPRSTRTWAPS